MRTATRIAIGVGITSVVFVALILFVGVERFVDTILSVDPWYAGAIVGVIALRRMVQGLMLYTAFNSFGVRVSYVQSIFISASTSFANNVTPFAQFGGQPLAAGIITDAVKEPYERCLAATSTIDTIRFIPSTTVFVFGALYLTIVSTAIPPSLRPLFGLFGAFLATISLLAIVVWKFKSEAETVVVRVVFRVVDLLSVVPYVPAPEREDVRNRVVGFTTLFVDLATDRRLVAVLTTLSFTTTFLTVFELWLALRAVGIAVPIAIVLFAVPFSQLASILPSPGGVGGIEAVLVIFITALTENAVRGVTTAVVLSSGAGYWMTTVVGGLGIAIVLPLMSED